jgi:hypothetical protein
LDITASTTQSDYDDNTAVSNDGLACSAGARTLD